MRRFAFFAPLSVALAAASLASAQPANLATAQPNLGAPEVTVTIGGDLSEQVDNLGQRDVDLQTADLARTVRETLARRGALAGAQVHLVLTDLKPNRPTMQQTVDKPGLSSFDSISIGGATIEGEIVTADGQRLPVRYSRYSNNLADVYGYSTWQDARRAYDRLADNLVEGRLVSR